MTLKDVRGTCVIMPAYNEAGTVADLARRILALGVDRLIVVDDGSTDGTGEQLAGLGLDLLTNARNLGKGGSLLRGLRHAFSGGYERLITIDADGQHDPDDIPRLCAAAAAHPDMIVIAARTEGRANAPWLRRFANGFADFWISWACGQAIADTQSGFRLYPVEAIRRVATQPRPGAGFAFESELLIDAARLGWRSTVVPIRTRYNPGGRKSHYRPLQDTWGIVRMVAGKLLGRGMYPLGLLRALGVEIPSRSKRVEGPRV
jgi:glycosyltransferase involved in cell wall biosynthesis